MSESLWLATLPQSERFLRVSRNLQVDVVVIGGGITGVTAAYLMKREGLTVALLEKGQIGHAETGHTTAHLTQVTDIRLSKLVNDFGKDHARAAWDASLAAIDQIDSNIRDEAIDCDLCRVPSYLHAPIDGNTRQEETSGLKDEADLAVELGFEASYVADAPFVHQPAVMFPNQARFHPAKYVNGLVGRIPGDGSYVFEDSEVEEIAENPIKIRVGGYHIQCSYVVIATHVPLMGKTGLLSATMFQSKITPYSTYAVAAEISPDAIIDALFWDTADPYRYLRFEQQQDRAWAILGGEDHKTGQVENTEQNYQHLEQAIARLFPDCKLATRWSGQVIETHDGLPYIGETAEGQFVATGFAGNGITFGTLAAIMARDAATNRSNPWTKLFSPSRKQLSGVWDYVKENFDYPYYMIKDRLTSDEGKSTRSVRRGEGKILKLDGQRVAAYRDDKGKLTCLSPVCTHMGCIVHWNKAEKTWDCPCHGSRFQATGEVMAGPAETPLKEQEQPNRSATKSPQMSG